MKFQRTSADEQTRIRITITISLLAVSALFGASNTVIVARPDLVTLPGETRMERPPFTVTISNRTRHVLLVGTEHTADTASATFRCIRDAFQSGKPDVLVIEREHSGLGINPRAEMDPYRRTPPPAIRSESDFALICGVRAGCDVVFGEPPHGYIVSNISSYRVNGRSLSETDLLYFYFIRVTADMQRRGMFSSAIDFAARYESIITERRKRFGFSVRPGSYETFTRWYQDLNGETFSYERGLRYDPANGTRGTDMIGKYVSHIRDTHLIWLIATLANSYKRILVVYGGGHAPSLEPALREMFRN
ncbi:MAG: hypothetical protein HZC28_16700 [Spirochaetes bacterium]|nr:hypothetical protein [Spirochaetota bacterium]